MSGDRFCLFLQDDTHDLYAGTTTSYGRYLQALEAWQAAGWAHLATPGELAKPPSKQRELRMPYKPARCPLCRWSGLNLGVHFAKVHPGENRPNVVSSEALREQVQRNRRQTEKARRVRAGRLVVRTSRTGTDGWWEVWHVTRVSGDVAWMTDGIEEKCLPVSTVIEHYRPVGRWPSGGNGK